MEWQQLGHPTLLLLSFALVLSVAGRASAAGRGVTDSSRSPHVAQRTVDMGDVRWTEGFWAEKLELCRTEIIPAVERGLLHPENSEQLANLLVAAGMQEGEHKGTDWSDGDCYKWLESLALVYAATGDPALDEKLDYWIDVSAKAQTPQGYLSTNIGSNPEDFLQLPYRHELYNMGHLLHAACTTNDQSIVLLRRIRAARRRSPDRAAHRPEVSWNRGCSSASHDCRSSGHLRSPGCAGQETGTQQ